MSEVTFLDGAVRLIQGDCRDAVAGLADNSVDSAVMDPPYALVSIVKRFGKTAHADETKTSERTRRGADGYARLAKGFMGKEWDNGDTAFDPEFWSEVLRVLKPGGHLISFSGTRTYHRMACAVEDAGFEIRDQIGWAFGSGFPKSHDVSKGIDKAAGAVREKGPVDPVRFARLKNQIDGYTSTGEQWEHGARSVTVDQPATPEAAQWEGWGTALKPAWEPVVLARKPLSEPTVAANVLRWGTGALNIGATRIDANDGANRARPPRTANAILGGGKGTNLTASPHNDAGRWPANVIHDGSAEVVEAFPVTTSPTSNSRSGKPQASCYGDRGAQEAQPGYADQGSAARFFYSAKADSNDRIGSKHPTVKPVDLMRYLTRLVTPPGGTVLDCFAGTGTTGEAAFYEGFKAILCEREAEYIADIERRMKLCLAGPDERAREIVKAKGEPDMIGTLFEEVTP